MLRPSLRERGFARPLGVGERTVPDFGVKRKGIAQVRLPDGNIRLAEIHWYEAHAIGRREYKIKQLL
jgi:hypothetical protein